MEKKQLFKLTRNFTQKLFEEEGIESKYGDKKVVPSFAYLSDHDQVERFPYPICNKLSSKTKRVYISIFAPWLSIP